MTTLTKLTIAHLGSSLLSSFFPARSKVEAIASNGESFDSNATLWAIWAGNKGSKPTNYAITTNGDPEVFPDLGDCQIFMREALYANNIEFDEDEADGDETGYLFTKLFEAKNS